MEYEVSSDWWKSNGGFFNDIYLEGDNSIEGFLNSPLDLDTRTKQEVEGVVRLCQLRAGSRILDCPSGYGRHSLALGKMGYDLVGADINEKFLSIANESLEKTQLPNVNFIKQDMRELSFYEDFDAVINMFYSLGFFDDDKDNQKALTNFFKALKPGGKFLMHTHVTVPKFERGLIKTHEIRNLRNGKRLELFRKYNYTTKREEGQWFLLDGSGRKNASTPYSMKVYTEGEFESLCQDTGFRSVVFWGHWNGEKYHDESELMIAVATK